MNTAVNWRTIQRSNFTSIESLLHFLEMDEENRKLIDFSPKFILNLPLRLAEKMKKNSISDPLFCQFVPLLEEKQTTEGFTQNPTEDDRFLKGNKLLRKYNNRALLICTSACAMHCRYCFRQNFEYTKELAFDEEIALIQEDVSLSEVILSGGDPLSFGCEKLEDLLFALSQIPHIQRIRFHTRFPIGIPERIDNELLDLLESCPTQIIFVVHINHPSEIDADVLDSLKRVQKLGIPVLNQSVLLKGVNDNPDTLLELSEILVNNGILPYYLHQLDRIEGAAHFEVPDEKGLQLINFLEGQTSGYAVPRYVREIAGQPSKTALHAIQGLQTKNVESLL